MEAFGTTAGGDEVHRVSIAGGGLTAAIIDWGAVVQDLRLEGHPPPLVLGFDEFGYYPAHSPYFGAIVGRFANRIAGGRFAIDGAVFRTDRNAAARHTLHGGGHGIDKRVWRFTETGSDFATLALRDTAGEMGFPGNLDIECTYRLLPGGRLSVELRAKTDAPTPCNLAHHSYFNLEDGGRSDIFGHRLLIEADAFLPVDEDLIPTGTVQPIAGTPFDFRHARPIRHDGGQFYDHCFCLSAARRPLCRAAWAQAPVSGLEMEVWTTEPGLQFYAGGDIIAMPPGIDGIDYRPASGFCLEAQGWPDSPNRRYFPSSLLAPGETYRQVTEYRFHKGPAEITGP
ncbi:MAG: aldose epimerase family protein [Rhizobiaceae bacterium]